MTMRLSGSELLEVAGADAARFAQAQFINDVDALSDSDWQWSGWLTPKGRLLAFFALARLAGDRFLLWLPAGGAGPLRERLQRYVFRSKVTIRVLDDGAAFGTFGALPGDIEPVPDAMLKIEAGNQERYVLILPADPPTNAENDEPDALRTWRLADLRMGVPYIAVGAGNSEQFVPQWLSLGRLNAFSLKKGCYPGQEIVARMHYLGQSKRAAYRLGGKGTAPQAMARVLDADGAGLGEVVWAQQGSEGWEALAVLATDKADRVERIEPDHAARLIASPT